MRTGVPVFMRATRMPWRAMLSEKWWTAGSAMRPPSTILCPICISPLRKVPAVTTIALAWISIPHKVLIPNTLESFTSNSSAWSWRMSRSGIWSRVVRHSKIYFSRSHWARGLHMAGPLDRLSIRNCIAVASVMCPISPPKASISRTICPLAIPPTAGLQLICAILFMSIVIRQVLAPVLAAAEAASQPACPPPMTRTSYSKTILAFPIFSAKVLIIFEILPFSLCLIIKK